VNTSSKGSISLIALGVALLLIMLMLVFVEMTAVYENSEYAVDVIQRACNSAVQMSIMDEYRADRILKMDTDKAQELFYEYLAVDSQGRFSVNVYDIEATDTPPQLIVRGEISFPTVFSKVGFESFSHKFEIRSSTIDLE